MTRPVDIDGTPLHVGDLVEWVDGRDLVLVEAGARLPSDAPTHPRRGAAGSDVVTALRWDGEAGVHWVDLGDGTGGWHPRRFRLVPRSRHDRIVRMSDVRPQVVRVVHPDHNPDDGWSEADSWAVIRNGTAEFWSTVIPQRFPIEDAYVGVVLAAPTHPGRADDGSWRIP